MPRRSLTERFIATVKSQGQTDFFDSGYPGLSLRVSYGGTKSFAYIYRLAGKQHRLSLGTYPGDMGLAEAREAWREARREVKAKRDPHPVIKDSAARTFSSVADEWLLRDQSKNKSVGKIRRIVELNLLPKWGDRPASEITDRDVIELLDGIVDRGAKVMSTSVQRVVHRMFAWAVGRRILKVNPAAGLDMIGEVHSRDRVLTDTEIVAVWQAAERMGGPYGPAAQLLLLCGARREEVSALKWSEVVDGEVQLSGSRTKNGQPHTIPLSKAALAVLDRVQRYAGSDFVFTPSGKKPLAGWPKAKVKLDRLAGIAPWRIHDLRRTIATGLQKLGVPVPVTEAALGHTSGSRSGIVGVYQKYDYANEKRAALEAWGARVMALVEGRNTGVVVPIKQSA
jgi:integrase